MRANLFRDQDLDLQHALHTRVVSSYLSVVLFVHISFVLSFFYPFLADLGAGYREAPLGRQGAMIWWRSAGRGWTSGKYSRITTDDTHTHEPQQQ